MIARTLLRLFAIVYIVRFAAPALLSASQAAPFGVPWMESGNQATQFLDSDIRYWGVTCATIAALFFVLSFQIKRYLVVLDTIMVGVLIGAIIRTVEAFTMGMPVGPALVATVFEWLFPILWFASSGSFRQKNPTMIEESIEVNAAKAKVWQVFGDYGAVHDWHPYMEKAYLDEGSPEEGIGAARVCEFGPKMAIRETVVEWDDGNSMTIAIDFLKGMAPPIQNIRASVRVESLGEERCRLVLTMRYATKLGFLGYLMNEMMIIGQYQGVFGHMLEAAKQMAETGESTQSIAMPGSGRVLATA